MNDITFNILKIIFSICIALVTAYLIPYIKSMCEDARYKNLVDMVAVAVRAAEQTFRESGMGAQKKEEVLNFISEYMTTHGFSISSYQLDQLIECAVYQMKQGGKV